MVSIYEQYNCSFPESHHPDEEYSDISGIGVVIAFITVGYLVVLLSLLDYFLYFGRVPSSGVHQDSAGLRNQVDRAAVIPCQRALQAVLPSLLEEPRVKEIHDVLHEFVMTISEAQTYTGIAILISGVIVLFRAALSEYHWEMVVLLAWSCHVTNVTAMTSFRSHLLDRPLKRYWTLCLMACLVVMLVMATLPTGFWYGATSAEVSRYAICAITPERIREVGHAISHIDISYTHSEELNGFLSMALRLCIICVTLCTRAVKLSARLSQILSRMEAACEKASNAFLRWFDDSVSRVRSNVLRHYLVHGIEPSILALLLSAKLHRDFLTSMLSELVFALASIGWVTRQVNEARNYRWTYGPQNQWTFGQILPLALLMYPLVSLAERLFPLFVKTYIAASPSASEPHNDTSTGSTAAPEEHGPSSTDLLKNTPIKLYLNKPSAFGQTWPWRSYVTYQYLFQVFLIATNLAIQMITYPVVLILLNFDTIFLLHPLTTYMTILLHMQAEFILNLRYPVDSPNRQRKAGIFHISVCAIIAGLFFGLDALASYPRILRGWWFYSLGWHFPNFMIDPTFFTSIYNYFVKPSAWACGYTITYHVVALGISLWTNFRTTGVIGAEGAEIALEDGG